MWGRVRYRSRDRYGGRHRWEKRGRKFSTPPRSRTPYVAGSLLAALAITGLLVGPRISHYGSSSIVATETPIGRANALVGRASVIDGDTIEIAGQRVRLNGVDAPETEQGCQDRAGHSYRCGVDAARALDDFLAHSRPTRCEFVEWDRYGRFVGDCYRADAQGVAAWLVGNGYALDWPKYSRGAYASEQARAKSAGLGLWSGSFETPWHWRAEAKSGGQAAISAPQSLFAKPAASASWSCETRRTCGQIRSCEEAQWYLATCSWGPNLDRDRDGRPCESLC
jgi:endonuclease YncB( thermonuclease family)